MELLETERLILREWNIDDAVDLYEYAKSEKVGPMAGWKPHENLEESRRIIKMFMEQDETWAICLKNTNKVIGSIGLHPSNNEKELVLGYVLSEEYWGRGFAVEASKGVLNYAFNTLKLDSVAVCHFPFNYQSKRVIEKLGFKYFETREKSHVMFDGSIYDSLCYRLSKEEFNK